ncbi:putative RNA-directed DNA polymerase, eukaryota, reverse transcriptase zinc-binding domain protein [Tanacetum coccineum]
MKLSIKKWSIENASNLCHILRCFNLASGLKVNFFKSKLFGVGIDSTETHNLASVLNFQPSTLPCSYLGLPIGANMNKAINWKPIIDKFHKRLTSWKARTLSYGGRLTLLKSVLGALGTYFFSIYKAPKCVVNHLEKVRRNFFWGGSLDNNKIPWIAWKKVCSPKSCGGLGVGSLSALNLAMMSKWWWRFHLEKNSLWRRVITSIHGPLGELNVENPTVIRSCLNPWFLIISLNKYLPQPQVNLNKNFCKKIGDGCSTYFWSENWIGGSPLKLLYPRLYLLETSPSCKVMERCNNANGPKTRSWAWRRPISGGLEATQFNDLLVLLEGFDVVDKPDTWECNLNPTKVFTVLALRRNIESYTLLSTEDNIRWNRSLPIKVNIHTWRLSLDRLPTRYNLDACGIDVHSTRCAICDMDI